MLDLEGCIYLLCVTATTFYEICLKNTALRLMMQFFLFARFAQEH